MLRRRIQNLTVVSEPIEAEHKGAERKILFLYENLLLLMRKRSLYKQADHDSWLHYA